MSQGDPTSGAHVEIRCLLCGAGDARQMSVYYYTCNRPDTVVLQPAGDPGESEEVKTALALATLHLLGKGGEKQEGD